MLVGILSRRCVNHRARRLTLRVRHPKEMDRVPSDQLPQLAMNMDPFQGRVQDHQAGGEVSFHTPEKEVWTPQAKAR